MNAPLSIAARLALSSVQPKLPFGFIDDSGEVVIALDQWHQSFLPAQLPDLPNGPTDFGRKSAAEALAACRAGELKVKPAAPRGQLIGLTSWRETPRAHRSVLARLASLPSDIVDKLDRDLSENEKALLRAAARDLCESVKPLTSSI